MMTPKETSRLSALKSRDVLRANMQNFMLGLAFEIDKIAEKPETAARFAPAVLRDIARELRETAEAARTGALE